jgi:WD40 repeat protein/tRNA A-37 threonylcarbamoyl transferase component Bud32
MEAPPEIGVSSSRALEPIDVLEVLDAFDAAWRTGLPPSLDTYLNSGTRDPSACRHLAAELIKIDLEYRWRSADRSSARRLELEDYVRQWPALGPVESLATELIVEEYRVRQRWGDRAGHERYRERFPERWVELGPLLTRADDERATRAGPRQGEQAVAFSDRYEILGEVGRGAMGVVFKARDRRLSRLVAMKMVLPGGRAGAEDLARFRAEAEAIARLQHPNVVQVFEVGERGGEPYFAMEYLEGGSLSQRLHGRPLPPREAARLVQTLARALHSAHRQGIVHRDLKPANVLFTTDDTPKVVDFGLAKWLDREVGQTRSGALVGTVAYMAPELAAGRAREAGPAVDVYGLGAVLYEVLTGWPPFQAASVLQTLELVRSRDPAPPRRQTPSVPRDLDTICLTCLHKEPSRRYADAKALADDLQRFLDGASILARPAGPGERAVRWARRHKSLAALCALAFGAAAGLAWQSVAYTRQLADRDKALREGETALGRERAALAEKSRMLDEANEGRLTDTYKATLGETLRAVREGRLQDARRSFYLVPSQRSGWEADRLRYELARGPRPVELVGMHDYGILALLASRDGRTLLTSGQDGRVVAWKTTDASSRDLEPGAWQEGVGRWRHATTPEARRDGLDAFAHLCWLDDGRSAAGVSLGGVFATWDVDQGRRTMSWRHDRPFTALSAARDGGPLVAGDEAGVLVVVGRSGARQESIDILAPSPIRGIAPVAPVRWVVGQEDGTVSLIDLTSRRRRDAVQVMGPVWDLDASPDGRLVAVACARRDVPVYGIDAAAGALRPGGYYVSPTDQSDQPPVKHMVRYSPDGRFLAAGGNDGWIGVWDSADQVLRFTAGDQVLAGTLAALPRSCQRRHTGMAFAPDGRFGYTAGRDGWLKRWDLTGGETTTRFRVGAGPITRFDPTAPRLLWVGSADGSLALWDSVVGVVRDTASAHEGGVGALDVSTRANLAATWGRDGRIRFWTRQGERIRPVGGGLAHPRALRSLALSPDGRRLATYDERDWVGLWTVPSGASLGRIEIRGEVEGMETVGGLVAFNADGTRIAAAGPSQTFWILSGEDASVDQKTFNVVAGKGGTAVAWHPRDRGLLASGDSAGRVYGYPRPDGHFFHTDGAPANQEVVGLAFSPDGGRLAALYSEGSIVLFDHKWIGTVLALRSGHASASGITFDPTGRRLAATHRDGTILIWETARPSTRLPDAPRRAWVATTCLSGRMARGVNFDPRGVGLDHRGRVRVLYTRLETDGQGKDHTLIMLGTADQTGGYGETLVKDLGVISGSWAGTVRRSLAMMMDGDDVVISRGPASPESTDGFVLERFSEKSWTRETPTMAENSGFDVALFPGPFGAPRIFHFTHDGNYLLQTLRTRAHAWRTTRIGRQGDGFGFHAAPTPNNSGAHLAFRSFRFGGDPSINMYADSRAPRDREAFDRAPEVGLEGLTTDPSSGRPVILYSRPDGEGGHELLVAPPRFGLGQPKDHGLVRPDPLEPVVRPPGNAAIRHLERRPPPPSHGVGRLVGRRGGRHGRGHDAHPHRLERGLRAGPVTRRARPARHHFHDQRPERWVAADPPAGPVERVTGSGFTWGHERHSGPGRGSVHQAVAARTAPRIKGAARDPGSAASPPLGVPGWAGRSEGRRRPGPIARWGARDRAAAPRARRPGRRATGGIGRRPRPAGSGGPRWRD